MAASDHRSIGQRLAVIAAALGITLVTLGSAPASADPVSAGRCVRTLTTSIAWDHVDPAFMFMTPSVRWRNCRGTIRQVVLELRRVNFDGGVADTYRRIYIPNILRKANRVEAFHESIGLVLTGSPDTPGAVAFNRAITSFRSCTVLATGDSTTALSGVTFYTLATAYDIRGKEILKSSSPIVTCDQNG